MDRVKPRLQDMMEILKPDNPGRFGGAANDVHHMQLTTLKKTVSGASSEGMAKTVKLMTKTRPAAQKGTRVTGCLVKSKLNDKPVKTNNANKPRATIKTKPVPFTTVGHYRVTDENLLFETA